MLWRAKYTTAARVRAAERKCGQNKGIPPRLLVDVLHRHAGLRLHESCSRAADPEVRTQKARLKPELQTGHWRSGWDSNPRAGLADKLISSFLRTSENTGNQYPFRGR